MLFALLAISLPPLGALKQTWSRYETNIHEFNSTFTCFDGSKSIPLSQFNDGFADCPDASDEPSTGADPNATFYCRNDGIDPIKIKGWQVGDGICDCCDGSDEAMNPHANCPNTCNNIKHERDSILSFISTKFKRGLAKRNKLDKSSISSLTSIEHQKIRWRTLQDICDLAIPWLRNHTDSENQELSSWQTIITSAWKFTFRPARHSERPNFLHYLQNALADDLESANASAAAASKTLDQARPLIEAFPAAVHFLGQKFSHDIYTLEFMSGVRKRKISLGTFANVTGKKVYFTGGDYCWEIETGRTMELQLLCGEKNALVTVHEPSICVYRGVFTTPIVCTQSDIESLRTLKLKKAKELGNFFSI